MASAEPAPVRLRIPIRRRFGPGGPMVLLGSLGIVVGIGGLSELAASSTQVTAIGKVVFALFGLACLLLGGWLLRAGVRLVRHAAGRLPVLEATTEAIRLARPKRTPRQLARDRVTAATFEVRRPQHESEAPLAYLEWLDADHRSLGVWTVDPIIGGGLPRFLRAIDVALVDAEDE